MQRQLCKPEGEGHAHYKIDSYVHSWTIGTGRLAWGVCVCQRTTTYATDTSTWTRPFLSKAKHMYCSKAVTVAGGVPREL